MTCNWRRHQQRIRRRVQLEMLLGMRQCIVGYERSDMRQLGRFRSQELLARWRIKEEIANRDRRSHRQPGLFDTDNLAPVTFEERSRGFLLGAGFQMQPGDRSNRRQRLAAKSECRNAQQVVSVFDFRGGVALESQNASSRTMPHPLSAIWIS